MKIELTRINRYNTVQFVEVVLALSFFDGEELNQNFGSLTIKLTREETEGKTIEQIEEMAIEIAKQLLAKG